MPTAYDAAIGYDGAAPSSTVSASGTPILTGYNVESFGCIASINGRVYLTNDFDRVQVWDGLASSLRSAGIAGPSTALGGAGFPAGGTITAGTHLVRYRYIDSSSPAATYRSNASAANTAGISAGFQQISYAIYPTATSTGIIKSTDPKVDTIQIEMTLADGSDYFVVTTISNATSAATVTIDISDALLTLNEAGVLYDTNLDSTTDYGVGHDQPPLAAIITQCKHRTFLGGSHSVNRTVGVTLSSTGVTGLNFSSLWSGRMLQVSGDTAGYQIASATSSTVTLAKNYAGATSTAASATIYSRTPNTIYWSAAPNGAQLPESYKTTQLARNVLNGTGDQVTGLINWQGDLLIAGRFTMERLIFDDDPATGELVSVATKFGVWNQRCFVVVDSRIFGWGPNGIWEMRAAGPAWISHPIDLQIASASYGYIDVTKSSQIHGVYDPTEKVIRWFYVKTGETIPRQSVCIDLQGRRWTRATWRQGIDSSCNFIDSTGDYRAVLSDATDGQTWNHQGSTDGVPSTSTGDYTVTLSSTTTVIKVIDALPTASTGLTGCMLYVPATLEERAILSNTASTITLATALSSAPTSGSRVYVGAIPCYMETSWYDADRPEAKKQAHLFLRFVPSSAGGTMRVRLYTDFSATPQTWTKIDNVLPPRGVQAWANGQTYVDVSMASTDSDGFVKIPMFANFNRHLKASLEVISPAGTLRLLDFSFQPTRVKPALNE